MKSISQVAEDARVAYELTELVEYISSIVTLEDFDKGE